MSVTYDGDTKKITMLTHAARELTANQPAGQTSPGTVTFQVPVQIPAQGPDAIKRIRFIIRDAVSGHMGTADVTP
jgi:hypothetical protein